MTKIPQKTEVEIEAMRKSCALTAAVLDAVDELVKPGISTEEINTHVHKLTVDAGAIPSPLNYKGYPKSSCTSINDVVCHGIPSPYAVLKVGDIVNVDVSCYLNGFHGDSSRMYMVGGADACTPEAQKLVRVTELAMYAGIKAVGPGRHVGDIGAAIQALIAKHAPTYGIVREYTGHGIGREFHEPPQVLHIGKQGHGDVLRPGNIFTIEPMINGGTYKTILSKVDGWTVRTADGELSAQWEHTVLVTDSGSEILTMGKNQKIPKS